MLNAYGPYYMVSVCTDFSPFRLERKVIHWRERGGKPSIRRRNRTITRVEEYDEEIEYVCIGVDSPSHLYLAGRGMIPTHNSEEADSMVFRDKQWEWYQSTLYTRLHKGAAIIVIQTRWHIDDLAGRLIKSEADGGDHFEVINLPAIATADEEFRKQGEPLCKELFPIEELNQKKAVVGPYYWSAMFQQTPISAENQEFRLDYFRYEKLDEVLKKTTRKFMTIDTAISKKSSADYTGIVLNFVDREGKWHLMTWKRRFSPKELMDFIFQMWETYKIEKIGIEKTIYLMALKEFFNDEMRKRGKFPHIVELDHGQINKETRIRGVLAYYASGTIAHITGECEGLEEELLSFPKGVHDDVIDALAYQKFLVAKPYEDNYKKVHTFKPVSFR